jgi:hypothetical protein
VTYPEVKRQVLGLSDTELAFQKSKRNIECDGMGENVVDYDACIGGVIDGDVLGGGYGFPSAVDVVDKFDENSRAVDGPEGHDIVGPFDSIRALKGKLKT